jgi:hypothetical protein
VSRTQEPFADLAGGMTSSGRRPRISAATRTKTVARDRSITYSLTECSPPLPLCSLNPPSAIRAEQLRYEASVLWPADCLDLSRRVVTAQMPTRGFQIALMQPHIVGGDEGPIDIRIGKELSQALRALVLHVPQTHDTATFHRQRGISDHEGTVRLPSIPYILSIE